MHWTSSEMRPLAERRPSPAVRVPRREPDGTRVRSWGTAAQNAEMRESETIDLVYMDRNRESRSRPRLWAWPPRAGCTRRLG